MTKVSIRTGDVSGFFNRASQAARKADKGDAFGQTVILSFEDPQRMFTVLSESRRRLMLEIMVEPKTINDLSSRLKRNRFARVEQTTQSRAWNPENGSGGST